MAEIVGLIASVVQLAGTGLKLSISLYTFAETVATADKSISHIAKDISLTSAVLDQLGENLKDDRHSGIASDNAVKTADEVVHECSEVFDEIHAALDKATGKGKGKVSLGKFKWPFLQPKMELLRSNLDRLKSTLTLMLHVLTHARSKTGHRVKPSEADLQRDQIQALIEANKRAVSEFQQMRRTIGSPSHFGEGGGHGSVQPLSQSHNSEYAGQGKGVDSTNRPVLMSTIPSHKSSPSPYGAGSSTKTPGSVPVAIPDTILSAASAGYVQLMLSMDATALIQWLQNYGGIVDDIKIARSILTATDVRRGRPTNLSSPSKKQEKLYIQDADGLLIPATWQSGGPVMITDTIRSDHSPTPKSHRGSDHERHYSSDGYPDDRARMRERLSRTSSSLDPEVEKKMQRLSMYERKEEEEAARLRLQEAKLMAKAKKPNEDTELPEKKSAVHGKKIIDLTQPTYIKVHRKHLSPDTLDLYDLPWEWDDHDSNYIIIKRWIPERDQVILFEHTKRLREGRLPPSSTVEMKKERDNLLLVRKKSPGRTRAHMDEVDKLLGEWTTLQLDPEPKSDQKRRSRSRSRGYILT